ncbi:MAG: PqqD family protein [Gemmatimonadaceae bacterium]
MLSAHSRLVPNNEECAAKVIDGEAVIINLSNGTYYSMDKAGGAVWSLMADGRSVQEIADGVAARYDVSTERALTDVQRLLGELVEEKLVAPANGTLPVPAPDAPPAAKLPYEEPRLNSYRDMADLLALDPPMPGIKEVPWQEPAPPAVKPTS